MPALDRRIVIRRTVTARDQFGEAVETTTDFPLWATREDFSQADKELAGGVLTTATRGYIVRYRPEIADAITSELSVIDGALTLDATNITEATLWTLLTKVETSCDRILIAGGTNVEAEWEQGSAV